MALIRKQPPDRSPEAAPHANAQPKFARPKILLLDISAEEGEVLRKAGYNTREGTFGKPVAVPAAPGKYRHLKPRAELPNFGEQEVVVVDLGAPDPVPDTVQEDDPSPAQRSVWVKLDAGVIDPRPHVMAVVAENSDRILSHGGIFILLCDERTNPGYVWARPSHSGLYVEEGLNWDNWGCLSVVKQFNVRTDYGVEMEPAATEAAKVFPLAAHLADSRFTCVFGPPSWLEERWVTLATNKYGDPVAGVLGPEKAGEGWLILLPRIRRVGNLVRQLLDEVLPALAPPLFPHAEGLRWTRRDQYELPSVVELRSKIQAVELESRERIRQFEQEIEEKRHQYAFLHELLTASGDDLVAAVIEALKALGFQDVRDVDAQADEETKGNLREDVQICDRSPTLLIEVKGIGGLPREADSLQVTKYDAPRMREWDRTDVQGLSIVNHQRKLPALDRENTNIFQPDVLTNAEAHPFGLLTAWDLFRLVRGFLRNDWTHAQVADLFYRTGRIEPVPSHYGYVGQIDGYWEQAGALGLRLEAGAVAVGDTLAYELPVDFFEECIESLQLDSEMVDQVNAKSHVGVKTALTKQQAKDRTAVYRVR